MGKEDEIIELLEDGLKPVEIIKRGYAKATVYKAYSIHRGIKSKRGIVKIRYVVSGLEDKATHIVMRLREYREILLEDIERARHEAELEKPVEIVEEGTQLQKVDFAPEPETFEEKVVAAMKKQIPEFFGGLIKTIIPPEPPTRIFHQAIAMIPQEIELYLTREQYAELGRPPLLSVINLTLR